MFFFKLRCCYKNYRTF